MDQMQIIPYDDAEKAVKKLERHQVDLLVDLSKKEFMINELSSKGRLLRDLFVSQQNDALIAPTTAFSQQTITGKAVRYVDWLVPGIIGLNMVFSSLFGVGFVLVRYRKNGVLKRLKATPVNALNFVTAQAVSRLIIVFLTSVVVYAGANIFLNFMMIGSYFDLILLTLLTIFCMIALGLVVAARMRSEEFASGILNIVTMPMMALSGVFFSLEGSPAILKTAAAIFPLTHFVDGARAIMMDGAGLLQILPNLLYLAITTVVFLVVSAALFKWE
jgi:ABC-type multidrug transport system permease subunit